MIKTKRNKQKYYANQAGELTMTEFDRIMLASGLVAVIILIAVGISS